MSAEPTYIGLDFGTANSGAARFCAREGRAEVLPNAEGAARTPSLVCFAEGGVLVGRAVEELLEASADDAARRREAHERIVQSVKSRLLTPPLIHIPGHRDVRPTEVAAEVLRKLRLDAQRRCETQLRRAVLACPARFDAIERKRLAEAAALAGWWEVELLEEPVAAAIALERAGLLRERCAVVYDLGGGTFDLALVARAEGDGFRVVSEPEGDTGCAGDDFDQALYDLCARRARQESGAALGAREGALSLGALLRCRALKERLSAEESATLELSPAGRPPLRVNVSRAAFQSLIEASVEKGVRQTAALVRRAQDEGHEVGAVLLVGGATRVPLVREALRRAVKVEVRATELAEVSVALGAAAHAHTLWGEGRPPAPRTRWPVTGFKLLGRGSREGRKGLIARELGARSASDWAGCARSWAGEFDNRREAVRCLRKAERAAETLADWLLCAEAWKEALDSDVEALRCFNSALPLVESARDWATCARHSLRLFPESPAARQFMLKAESVAETPADVALCADLRRRLFGEQTEARRIAPAVAAGTLAATEGAAAARTIFGGQARASAADRDAVLDSLRRHASSGTGPVRARLYVQPGIPRELLDDLRPRTGTPATETVLGLLDLSLPGFARTGIIFGAEGAYSRLGQLAVKDYVPYGRLRGAAVSTRRNGEFAALYIGARALGGGDRLRPELAALLCAILNEIKGRLKA